MKLAKVFKENKQFTLFSILALVVVGVAVFAPQIAPYDPLDAVILESLQAPSSAHPFGTDKLGRDLLSRVIFGTRTSLVMTLCLVAVIFVIGTFLGVIAGYFGGIVDGVIMRIADMMISFPGLVLAIAIAGMLEVASLSFLGFGATAPTPEWGLMLNEGRTYMAKAPWLMIYPGIAIVICVVVFNMLGDSIRDVLDPRQE